MFLIYIHVVAVALGTLSAIAAFCFFQQMLNGISPEKKRFFNLFPNLVGVIPGSFTKAGEEGRFRFVITFFSAAAFGVVAWLTYPGVPIASILGW